MIGSVRLRVASFCLLASTALACGYTKEEYQLQGDKLTRAEAKLRTADQRADEASAELEVAKEQLTDLEKKMRLLGIDIEAETRPSELAATIAERERALAEHRARQAKLGEIRARLALLRSRLATLREQGVAVVVRDNHVAIEVAGDLLFDPTKDKLKAGGKDALTEIGTLLKNEPSLAGRSFQIAGHVDGIATKSRQAAIALSAGRAAAVLGFLSDPKGAAVDRKLLSAAGFGAEAPLDNSDADDARKRNRRLEIVLVPAAGELLDLRALAEAAPKPAGPLSVPATEPAKPAAPPKPAAPEKPAAPPKPAAPAKPAAPPKPAAPEKPAAPAKPAAPPKP